MHHGTPSHALKILVVTEDRALARGLSQFLEMVGYQVQQAAEFSSAISALETESSEILLLDLALASQDNWKLCRLACERPSATGRFLFLLVDGSAESQIPEALEAGVDDFLATPIDVGEIQSRLRAAARMLEYDSRARRQSRVDVVTGLPSQSAFLSQARHASAAGAAAKGACVVLDLDFFERLNRLHGLPTANALLRAVTRELTNLRTGSEVLGSLGADRFCFMVPCSTETAAVQWAERVRQMFLKTEFHVEGTTCNVTASFGVSSCSPADRAEAQLDQATQAVHAAKILGRNCVVRWDEIGERTREVRTFGKLFERTIARDVMTPCTLLLLATESVHQASELLHNSRLPGIPVIDAAGKLAGLCTQEQVAAVSEAQRDTALVRDAMAVDVRKFSPTEDFATLMGFFTQDPLALAIVVDAGRPVGMLDCDSLLALSQAVPPAGLLPRPEFSDTSDYLLVVDSFAKECESTV